MNRPVLVFWGTTIAVTGGFAVFSALLLPFDSLGLGTVEERQRAWLLTLWTTGVMGILFGVSSLLGAFAGVGVREVFEAGSVTEAARVHRQTRAGEGGVPFHRNFGWWLVTVGGLLILTYFAAWLMLKR